MRIVNKIEQSENVMFQEKYLISQYMGSKSVQENHLSQMMIRNSMSPEKEEEGEGEKKKKKKPFKSP